MTFVCTNKTILIISPRQAEVLGLLADGYRVLQIANMMNIKAETVNLHIGRLRTKLGAKTNAHAISIAYENNLIKSTMLA